MVDYRETFRFWGGSQYEDLDRFRYKLRPDHWANKSFFVVSPAQGDVNVQLRKLLGQVKPINGIIRIDNESTTVNLAALTIKGKVLIVTTGTGGVKVSNLNLGERDNDLLTVVCLKGMMTIANEVHAALISTEGNLQVSPGAQIHGLLVAGKVPSSGDRQCAITRLDKYFSGMTKSNDASGAFTDYYYVGLSPRLVYKKVTRR
jgi:hypothetical protein